MKICVTGGIASGKSLLSRYLNELGVETIDADDVVHSLIPADERRRLAKAVFSDSKARKELEARIHPFVKERISGFLSSPPSPAQGSDSLRLAIIPLLFEVHWEPEFDIICSVVSSREHQLERMMTTRGMSREEAEARIAAQMPAEEKAAKSHYVIRNDGTAAELKAQAETFVRWLKQKV
jgi:dephospho-CoA kinase